MKKKTISKTLIPILVVLAVAVCLILIFAINDANEGKQAQQKAVKNSAINPIDADCYDCHVTYLDYEIVTGEKPRIMVYYQFENRSEKGRDYTYDFCTTSKAYQDGAMLDFYFGNSQAEKDCDTKIKPGGSIVVCEGYYLRNLQSPVEITVSEYVPLLSQDMGTMTIPIA